MSSDTITDTPGMFPGGPVQIIVGLVGLSIVLLVVGLVLRRRGSLASRGAWFGWTVLVLLPLFGAGLAFFITNHVENRPALPTAPVTGNE